MSKPILVRISSTTHINAEFVTHVIENPETGDVSVRVAGCADIASSDYGAETTVQMLTEHDADVNTQSDNLASFVVTKPGVYLTRIGEEATITGPSGDSTYPWAGRLKKHRKALKWKWTGRYEGKYPDKQHMYDLVAFLRPLDPSSTTAN